MTDKFDDITEDLLDYIFRNHLPLQDMARLRRTSRYFHGLASPDVKRRLEKYRQALLELAAVIGGNDGQHIVEDLKLRRWPKDINLMFDKQPLEVTVKIADFVKDNEVLSALRFSNQGLYDIGTSKIVRALFTNTTLLELILHANDISCFGAFDVARTLENNRTLTHLNLSYNNISDWGTTVLVGGLSKNPVLKRLDLECNYIGSVGASMLGGLLASPNTGLKWLDVSLNSIEDEGFVAIAESLRSNNMLDTLILTDNSETQSGRDAVRDAVRATRSPPYSSFLLGTNIMSYNSAD